jgi:amino acid transporter
MTIRHWHLTWGTHADNGAGTLAPTAAALPAVDVTGQAAQPAGAHVGGLTARRLGVIGLALVLISAMDSIRNLPTTATFGWSAIFFYAVAVLTYLVPVALCSAELATMVGGGVYRWVREAFGSRWGFLAVWCDWSENIVWFPTVLVFLATTLAYVINPDLSENKAFLVPVMLVIFWAVTLSSLFGALKSARWTGVGVVIGTAVPTLLIIGLGLWWVGSGHKSEIPYHAGAVIPAWHGLASLVYAAGIVVAFAGMEIGGFYSHVTRNVKRTYPSSVALAAVVVASLSILGSVAIAMVVPHHQIQLAGGIMQAVQIFFTELGIKSLLKPFGMLVIIGVLCGLASWSMGPAEGMRRVAADGHLTPWWGRTNRRGAPTSVLILQATLGSLLALLLVFVHNINTYYWMLTALVAQTFLIMYFLMYIAVVRLRITKPDAPRPFKIPGGMWGMGLVVGAGVVGAIFAFFLGFIPATHLSVEGTVAYVLVMAFGIVVIVGTPFLLHRGPAAWSDTRVDPNLAMEGTVDMEGSAGTGGTVGIDGTLAPDPVQPPA